MIELADIGEYELLPTERLDEIAVRVAGLKRLGGERELFAWKWFDYRFMHPVRATAEYIVAFIRVYRDAYARHVDTPTAEALQPARLENLFEDAVLVPARIMPGETQKAFARRLEVQKNRRRKLVALWRGRMVADAMGIPYPLYLSLAYRLSMKWWTHRYLPQPNHLYSPNLVGAIYKEWQEYQTTRLFLAQDDRYKNQAFVGSQHQRAHRAWAMRQIEIRGYDIDVVEHICLKEQVLPVDCLAGVLPGDQLDRLISSY